MRIYHRETGEVVIDQDEIVMEIVEGVNLDDVDISDLRIGSGDLAKLYNQACATDSKFNLEPFKRYAVMKAAVINMFNLQAE